MDDEDELKQLEKDLQGLTTQKDVLAVLRLEEEIDAAAEAMLHRAGLLREPTMSDASPRPETTTTSSERDGEEVAGESSSPEDEKKTKKSVKTKKSHTVRSKTAHRPRTTTTTISEPAERAPVAALRDAAERERESVVSVESSSLARPIDNNLLSLSLPELFSEFSAARRALQASSQALFRSQQSLQKLLEERRGTKRERAAQRETAIDELVVCALRDSELRFQKEQLLQAERAWTAWLERDQKAVDDARAALLATLSKYSETRRGIAVFQERVSAKSEELKSRSMNAVAFFRYAKQVMEHELQRPTPLTLSQRERENSLPSRKALQREVQEMAARVTRVRDDLSAFCGAKLLEFRRHERIVLGRAREMSEFPSHGSGNGGNGGGSTLSREDRLYGRYASTPLSERERERERDRERHREKDRERENKLDSLTDCYEFRVAQRLLSSLESSSGACGAACEGAEEERDSDDEYHRKFETIASSREQELRSAATASPQRSTRRTLLISASSGGSEKRERETDVSFALPAIDGAGRGKAIARGRQASVFVAPSTTTTTNVPRRMSTFATGSTSIARGEGGGGGAVEPTGREKENAKDHAVFDRARFLSLCGADTVHSHTLLDVDRGIGDKEQRLIDLVVALAQAKGEVARLSSVKEGLDIHLQKQAAVLLTTIDSIVGEAEPVSPNADKQKQKRLNLPSDCRTLQVEQAQDCREIELLHKMLFDHLFPV